MRHGSVNIVEQHIEKLILLAAVGFTGYLCFVFFLGNPYTVNYRGQEVGPTALDEEILQAARQLETKFNNTQQPDLPPVEQSSLLLEQQIEEGVWPKVGQLGRSVPFGQTLAIPGETLDPGNAIPLIRPLSPTNPLAFGGRSLVDRQQVTFGDPVELAEEAEVSWITVAAYWDRDAQREAHREAGYVSFRQLPYLLPPDVERQELLPTGEWSNWEVVRGSQAMPALNLPELEFDPVTRQLINKEEIDAAFELIKTVQLNLIQPRFYDVLAGDLWFIPELAGFSAAELEQRRDEMANENEGNRGRERNDFEDDFADDNRDRQGFEDRRGGRDRLDDFAGANDADDDNNRRRRGGGGSKDIAKDEYERALRAYVEGDDEQALEAIEVARDEGNPRGSTKRDLDRLMKLIERRALRQELAQPRWNDGIQQINVIGQPTQYALWFHDDTVTPGKTYRYRLRANIWNRYVNQPIGLANPQDARLVVLNGEWSEPTGAIEAPPAHQVFVTRTGTDRTIRANVWKWHRGWWFDQTFDAAVGDEIGDVKNIRMPLVAPDEADDNGRGGNRQEVDFATGLYLVDVRLEEPRGERDTDSRGGIEYDTPNTSIVVLRDMAGDTYEQSLFKGRLPNPNEAGLARR